MSGIEASAALLLLLVLLRLALLALWLSMLGQAGRGRGEGSEAERRKRQLRSTSSCPTSERSQPHAWVNCPSLLLLFKRTALRLAAACATVAEGKLNQEEAKAAAKHCANQSLLYEVCVYARVLSRSLLLH